MKQREKARALLIGEYSHGGNGEQTGLGVSIISPSKVPHRARFLAESGVSSAFHLRASFLDIRDECDWIKTFLYGCDENHSTHN